MRAFVVTPHRRNVPILAGLVFGCSETICTLPIAGEQKLHRIMGYFYVGADLQRIAALEKARKTHGALP